MSAGTLAPRLFLSHTSQPSYPLPHPDLPLGLFTFSCTVTIAKGPDPRASKNTLACLLVLFVCQLVNSLVGFRCHTP